MIRRGYFACALSSLVVLAGGRAVAQDGPQQVEGLDQALVGQAVFHVRTLPDGAHQTALAQQLEMARDRRLGEAQLRREAADVAGPLREGVEHHDAARVRECGAQLGVELVNFLGEGGGDSHVSLSHIFT